MKSGLNAILLILLLSVLGTSMIGSVQAEKPITGVVTWWEHLDEYYPDGTVYGEPLEYPSEHEYMLVDNVMHMENIAWYNLIPGFPPFPRAENLVMIYDEELDRWEMHAGQIRHTSPWTGLEMIYEYEGWLRFTEDFTTVTDGFYWCELHCLGGWDVPISYPYAEPAGQAGYWYLGWQEYFASPYP